MPKPKTDPDTGKTTAVLSKADRDLLARTSDVCIEIKLMTDIAGQKDAAKLATSNLKSLLYYGAEEGQAAEPPRHMAPDE